jgi:hypothetical protein
MTHDDADTVGARTARCVDCAVHADVDVNVNVNG